MSDFKSKWSILGRGRLLASAAVVALVAGGAAGGSMLSSSNPAHANAVNTSDLQTQGMPSFATVVERVKPAVVSVKVNVEEVAANGDDMSGQMGDLPPEAQQFFKQFGMPQGGSPDQGQVRHGMALGSGFLISADGYIVTNNHVVEHAKSVSVTLDNGKELPAKVVGTDEKTDLALLKITEPGDYPFVKLSKDTTRVGDWVLAIGNPFGLGGTVTAGIVSAEGRDIGSGPYDSFMQIDAPINKGNSGGPTFNLKGEVVGVNTAIFSPSGGSVGLGFAIPASTVDSVVASLEHGGVVKRGYLGVQIQPVSQDIADSIGLKTANGAMVDEAQPNTPAAEAGLKAGDVITKINGKDVKDAADLTRDVGALSPGDKAELTIVRDGQEKTVSLTLGSMKSAQTAQADAQTGESALKLGVQLAPTNDGKPGVAIVRVDPNGLAASKGVSNGDVILQVAGKTVSTPEDVKAGIAAAKHDGKKSVLMLIRTADANHFVAFEFPNA
jgi:serine protease Do